MKLVAGFSRIPLFEESDGPQELAGYAERKQPYQGVHDPLFINTLFLKNQIGHSVPTSVALIVLDTCLVDHNWQTELRNELSRNGIQSIITCTHTHAAPSTIHMSLHRTNKEYLAMVRKRILVSLASAQIQLRPVEKISVFQTTLRSNVIMNRTLVGGKVGFLHKRLNLETPAQVFRKIDPDLNIILIEQSAKDDCPQQGFLLVNLGCHSNVMERNNRAISRDFPGALTDFLESYFPKKITAVFINGAAGDVRPAVWESSWKTLRAIGAVFGGEVLAAMEEKPTALYKGRISLAFRDTAISIPYTDGSTTNATLSCLWIENQPILTIPGEIYHSLSLRIKDGFTSRPILIGFANGNIGYIPDRRCFEERHPDDTALRTWSQNMYLKGYGNPTTEPSPDIDTLIVEESRKILLQGQSLPTKK